MSVAFLVNPVNRLKILTQKLFELDDRYKSVDAFNVKKCAPRNLNLIAELLSLPMPDAAPRRKNLNDDHNELYIR